MRILGIDPGLAIVGWGIIDSVGGQYKTVGYGSIQTPAHTEIGLRLQMIYADMKKLIGQYHPDEMSVEELFFSQNRTTGIAVAEARGVLLLTASQCGIPVFEYTPMQIKQAVVGYGKAEKRQVIAMVTTMLRLKEAPKPDDTADAVAAALCHAQSRGLQVDILARRLNR